MSPDLVMSNLKVFFLQCLGSRREATSSTNCYTCNSIPASSVSIMFMLFVSASEVLLPAMLCLLWWCDLSEAFFMQSIEEIQEVSRIYRDLVDGQVFIYAGIFSCSAQVFFVTFLYVGYIDLVTPTYVCHLYSQHRTLSDVFLWFALMIKFSTVLLMVK